MTKIINLFSGPGAGKSTTAYGLTSLMKKMGHSVEMVHEFAKDCVWEKRYDILMGDEQDQLFVLANQNRLLHRLKQHNIEWIISDSPILLGLHYLNDDYYPKHFRDLTVEVWDSYDNISFFLDRPDTYEETGRTQTLEESIEIDNAILGTLKELNVSYTRLKTDDEIVNKIYKELF